ncbi:MAG: bifunctional phosphoribosylaminoimidazolecarboxamide formyltransferase/IMP cyclohydrolase [Candidatus Eremiobacteraeota bacterium]|nr:bifunctional phosphoribosylaminoimidazolecarboxamide formyltransferase/IMP cyclohydrolase [Candidatus Eremiobacteraeota bacterium]
MPSAAPAALLSLSDRSGLEPLARALAARGYRLIATSGTARAIAALGLAVEDVSDVTGFPPLLDGRVKTLHPAIMAGILADRGTPAHVEELREHAIAPFSVVAVTLYPFEHAASVPNAREADVIEQIDIGGVTLLRAAAKNYENVSVLSDGAGFAEFAAALERGGPTLEQRRGWAALAFARAERYDEAIAEYFARGRADAELPETLHVDLPLASRLRYGENPWARAAFYVGRSVHIPEQLSGKTLSYNNLLDVDSCLRLLAPVDEPRGFPSASRSQRRVVAAIVKHTVPCGVAARSSPPEALAAALGADPISAFGGIVACDERVDVASAELLASRFLEVVAAPGFETAALDVLRKKKNLRLLQFDRAMPERLMKFAKVRSALGGVLVEYPDPSAEPDEWRVVTPQAPTPEQWRDMLFAFGVVRQVKSNAAVVAADEVTLGICGGQTNRVSAVELACQRSGAAVKGAVLATDGFFPFADGVEAAARAGVSAVVAPSGSIRDEEVIAAARAAGIALVFTSRRYFLH